MEPRAPSPVPQRRSRRARPAKRARTSEPGESSSSRPQSSPSTPVAEETSSPQLSPASRIRRPLFVGTPDSGKRQTPRQRFPWRVFLRRTGIDRGPPVQELHALDYSLLPAAVHDTTAVLLSPGGTSVLPLHDLLGSTESARALIQY